MRYRTNAPAKIPWCTRVGYSASAPVRWPVQSAAENVVRRSVPLDHLQRIHPRIELCSCTYVAQTAKIYVNSQMENDYLYRNATTARITARRPPITTDEINSHSVTCFNAGKTIAIRPQQGFPVLPSIQSQIGPLHAHGIATPGKSSTPLETVVPARVDKSTDHGKIESTPVLYRQAAF